jgi:hypothetical protein
LCQGALCWLDGAMDRQAQCNDAWDAALGGPISGLCSGDPCKGQDATINHTRDREPWKRTKSSLQRGFGTIDKDEQNGNRVDRLGSRRSLGLFSVCWFDLLDSIRQWLWRLVTRFNFAWFGINWLSHTTDPLIGTHEGNNISVAAESQDSINGNNRSLQIMRIAMSSEILPTPQSLNLSSSSDYTNPFYTTFQRPGPAAAHCISLHTA